MLEANKRRSEIARLLSQIHAEYEAAQRGLSGLSSGGARHDFISTKMEQMTNCHEELIHLVGAEEAVSIIAETIWSPEDQGLVS